MSPTGFFLWFLNSFSRSLFVLFPYLFLWPDCPGLCLCLYHKTHNTNIHAPDGFFKVFCSLFILYPYWFLRFCLYCTTYTIQTSMPPAGFEPITPANDRPQTLGLNRWPMPPAGFFNVNPQYQLAYALDLTATGISCNTCGIKML